MRSLRRALPIALLALAAARSMAQDDLAGALDRLGSDAPLARIVAARVLREGGDPGRRALEHLLAPHLVPPVVPERGPDTVLVAGLIEQLGDESFEAREDATARLIELGPAAQAPVATAHDSTNDPEAKARLRLVLDSYDRSPAAERRGAMRLEAALALAATGSPASEPVLLALLADEDPFVAHAADLGLRSFRLEAPPPAGPGEAPPSWRPGGATPPAAGVLPAGAARATVREASGFWNPGPPTTLAGVVAADGDWEEALLASLPAGEYAAGRSRPIARERLVQLGSPLSLAAGEVVEATGHASLLGRDGEGLEVFAVSVQLVRSAPGGPSPRLERVVCTGRVHIDPSSGRIARDEFRAVVEVWSADRRTFAGILWWTAAPTR